MTVLLLMGSPRERGEQHGRALAREIREALGRWRALVTERGQDPDRRVRDLAEASPYVATISERCPDLLDEVRGIADGADVPFAEALVLNLMDEEWWFRPGEESGCSLLAGFAGGVPLLAQNMDLPAWMDGLQTVLRIRDSEDDPHERVLLSAAGMIGLTGMRRGGVAVGVNTLLQLPRSTAGLPVAFVIRSALEHPTAEGAAGALTALPHASGQHYAVVDDREVFGVEAGAHGASLRRVAAGEWIRHTNHPLWSDPAAIDLPEDAGIFGVRLHSSHRRLAALEEFAALAAAERGVDAARATLADRGTGVCMVASAEYPTQTFGSVEFSPATGHARVSTGHPDAGPWHDLRTPE